MEASEYKERFGVRCVAAPDMREHLSKMNSPITAKELDTIHQAWTTADIKHDLAPRLGYTRDTVRKHAKNLGLKPKREKWSKARVVEMLHQRAEKGLPLRYSYLKTRLNKLLNACNVHFGNVRNACRAAGVDYRLVAHYGWQRIWTPEKVLAEIARLSKNGKAPTCGQAPHKLRSAAIREFGNWGKAKAAAELRLRKRGP